MIREVHVYGKVAALHRTGEGTQHLGLGRALVEEACAQAAAAGTPRLTSSAPWAPASTTATSALRTPGLYQKRPLP